MLIAILPPVENIDFAAICRRVRKYIRYTQQEMADFLCVSKPTYVNWETGKNVPSGNIAVWLYNTGKELEKELSLEK